MNCSTHKIKIFIVEDHQMFLDSLKTSLGIIEEYCICGSASNGLEAIQKTRSLKPDLILMDITLPEMDGIQAAHEIKKILPNTKIIILTMHANNEDYVQLSVKAKLDGYILKTASLTELEDCIKEVLAGGKHFDKSIIHYLRNVEQRQNLLFDKELTFREKQVAKLVVEGYLSKEIADKLNISANTVHNHKSNIFKKLEISSSTQLAKIAMNSNLL
jgi:DNA-binding NarL/FixJ family response regulator